MKLTVLFLLMTAGNALSQSLPDALNQYLQRLPDTVRVSLAVESLSDSTVAFQYRADDRTPSASVIKLPVLVEAMEAVGDGRINPDEIYILLESDKVGGSGVLQTYPHRSRIAYRDLISLMMTHSDNTATNVLIRELGMKAVNERLRKLGATQSQLNRMMMDTAAVRRGIENYVTAQEMNTLLKKIYRYEVADKASCDQMLDILKRNEDTLTIPRLLPKPVAVAHKTGTLAYVRGDVGIVYARTPFILSVFVQGAPAQQAERIIGELARICYAYFENNR